jgi:hypothetical protein
MTATAAPALEAAALSPDDARVLFESTAIASITIGFERAVVEPAAFSAATLQL